MAAVTDARGSETDPGDGPSARRPRRLLVAGLVVIAAGSAVAFLLCRQLTRPLSLQLDVNVTGSLVTHTNTQHGQPGQWYAPYPASFTVPLYFWNSGPFAVRVDSVRIGEGFLDQGPTTYNLTDIFHGTIVSEGVAPAADRAPLSRATIDPNSGLTVDVPLHYSCDPEPTAGQPSTLLAARVTWELWGEHHTQLMDLPLPIITGAGKGGRACA